jgi:hypothetical protein
LTAHHGCDCYSESSVESGDIVGWIYQLKGLGGYPGGDRNEPCLALSKDMASSHGREKAKGHNPPAVVVAGQNKISVYFTTKKIMQKNATLKKIEGAEEGRGNIYTHTHTHTHHAHTHTCRCRYRMLGVHLLKRQS